jgi:hypothetical protein
MGSSTILTMMMRKLQLKERKRTFSIAPGLPVHSRGCPMARKPLKEYGYSHREQRDGPVNSLKVKSFGH